jgi:sugar phosphate isomerase/epimerase
MKIGVMAAAFAGQGLDKALDYMVEVGVEAIEVPTGNYPGDALCNPAEMLADKTKCDEMVGKIKSAGLEISALSCHGNPLHPDKKIAAAHHETHRKTVELAEKIGVKVVINFSGCPGGSESDTTPNWITCPWPDDFTNAVQWQWKERVIPYWKEEAKFAAGNGIKLAFEMHPGFVVYNTETMLCLRQECGDVIGANFDPSHLFWQGMDPLVSVRALRDCIWHVHAKDCRIDPLNTLKNGVLDTKHYGDEINRSWIFRTVGYGHGESFWRDFISELRMVGYDGVISIEHEDSLMSLDEGFRKAVACLKDVVLTEQTGGMWWA